MPSSSTPEEDSPLVHSSDSCYAAILGHSVGVGECGVEFNDEIVAPAAMSVTCTKTQF